MENHTVIVLGAGASIPFGLPSGSELKDSLAASLSDEVRSSRRGDYYHDLRDGLLQLPESFDEDQLNRLGLRIAYSPYASLDRFIDRLEDENSPLKKIGALAIAGIIKESESAEKLKGELLGDSWVDIFLRQILDAGEDPHEPVTDGFTILTFNYDRSLEAYLYRSFAHQFDDASKAARLVDDIDIVHLYGSIGSLSEIDDNRPDRDSSRHRSTLYSNPPLYGSSDIWRAQADELTTVHEHGPDVFELPEGLSTTSKPECDTVPELLASLGSQDRLIFLGFGFDTLNLDRLGADQFREEFDNWDYPTILGTGYGLPGITRRRLHNYFEPPNNVSSHTYHIGPPETVTLDFVDEFGVLHTDSRVDVIPVE